MGKLSKLHKNVENYKLKDMYNKMTPEEYQKGVQMAIYKTKKELTEQFNKKYNDLVDKFNAEMDISMMTAINIMSIELLYEFAEQTNAFNEIDPEILDAIKLRGQEMYENILKAIQKYANYKNDKQAHKKFEEKRKKIEKLFDIKI